MALKIVPTYTPEVDGRGWKDESNWPTAPVSEAEVRDRLQTQHDQVIDYVNRYVNTATDTGTANNLVVSFDPAPVSYAAGYELLVKAKYANTGACQINVNALGNKAIKKNVSADLESGDIVANQYIHLKYDGTYFQILNPRNAIDIERAKGFYSDLAAWYGNTKSIATMEADETWNAGSGAIISADTANFKVGVQGLKIEENDSTGSFLQAYRNGLSLDLTTLNNGEASTGADYICFIAYVPDYTKLAATGYNINFSSDDGTDTANRFLSQNLVPVANGFQFHKIAKSAFTVTGSPSWADIKRIRIGWTTVDGALGAYVTFDDIWLCKKDPSSAYPNPCQRLVNGVWTRDLHIAGSTSLWYVGMENNKIIWRELAYVAGVVILHNMTGYTDCSINLILSVGHGAYWGGPIFYVDSTNYVSAYVSAGNLILRSTVGGTPTTVTRTVPPFAIGDIVHYNFIKRGTSVTVIFYRDGESNTVYSLTASFSPTSAGYLGFGRYSVNNVKENIYSLSFTTTEHAHHADIAEVAKEVAALPYYNSKLASDVSMATTDTWYDAVSLTLPAGTWFLSGVATVSRSSAAATWYTARISDGTNHYASATDYRTSVSGNITSLPLSTVIVLTASTTIKLQCIASSSNTTIAAAAYINPAGNTATQLTAVKIGS